MAVCNIQSVLSFLTQETHDHNTAARVVLNFSKAMHKRRINGDEEWMYMLVFQNTAQPKIKLP